MSDEKLEMRDITTSEAMNVLQIMDSQIKNCGFYQWYFNRLEGDRSELNIALKLVRAATHLEFDNLKPLLMILIDFESAVEVHEQAMAMFQYDDEELEDTEQRFIDRTELLDDRYYADEWLAPLESAALFLTSKPEISYIAVFDIIYSATQQNQ